MTRAAGELNTVSGHVVCGWVSPDNLRRYYHTEIGGVLALQVSERCSLEDPWPAGIPLPGLEGLGWRLQMPRLTPDEKTVFFDASDIPGGFCMHPSLANDGSALYFMAQQGSGPTTRDIWVSYTAVPVPVPPTLPLPTATKGADGAPGSSR